MTYDVYGLKLEQNEHPIGHLINISALIEKQINTNYRTMLKSRLLVAIALALFANDYIMAQKVTIDKITYLIEEGEACVYEADKDIEVANILSSVEYKGKSYPVTKISHWNKEQWKLSRKGCAFRECKNLQSVTIPNSVVTIGSCAFAKCSSLRNITIPNSVTYIGYVALGLCSFQEISIPNSVKTLGMYAFANNPLTKVIVPDSPIDIFKGSQPGIGIRADSFFACEKVTEVRCQNGSFPTYMLAYLPEDCPFMLAQKYQQGGNNNNNMYAQNVQQAPVQQPVALQKSSKAPSSDVDIDIPQVSNVHKNTFAIIIANEDYQDETKVDYAKNDGEVFKNYCHKTFGLPEKNVHFVANATLNNLIGELDWLQQVCDAFSGEANVIFYYAGHGIPDEATSSAYLLPTDGNSRLLRTCFSINELYETLGKLPAKKVTVLMDACFSGAKRDGNMLASARGVAIKAKAGAPKGNMIVMSAAQGDETAYKYEDVGHGLFTYFLLKKLKETKGNVTMGELSHYLQEQVKRYSIVENGKSQTPSVQTSDNLKNNWESLRFD